jgi:hypothetical protein
MVSDNRKNSTLKNVHMSPFPAYMKIFKLIRCKLPIKWIIMQLAAGYYYPNNQALMSIASNAERNRGGRSNLKQEKT